MTTELSAHDSTTLFETLDIQHEDWIINRAMEIIEQRHFRRGEALSSPDAVRTFLRAKLIAKRHEVFAAVFLDSHHQIIAYEELFRGTVDQTRVYPRVVVTSALEHNATAVIFAHNHPSGVCEPSEADRQLTRCLQSVLQELDIRVLDHFIIGKGRPYSFAEHGLI